MECKKSVDYYHTRMYLCLGMKTNLLVPFVLLLILFSSEGCYTQLALFHPARPEETTLFTEDDYPYEINYIYSDFEPFLSSFSPYGDPFYGYGYSRWGFSDYYYGLTNQLGYPYGYGYSGNPYGYTNPNYLVAFASSHKKRTWNRRGGGTNLSIRRSAPQSIAEAENEMKRVRLITPDRSSYGRNNSSYGGRRSNGSLRRSGRASSYGSLSSSSPSGSGTITRSSSGAKSSSGSSSVRSKRNK